jgi:hypothetical protein
MNITFEQRLEECVKWSIFFLSFDYHENKNISSVWQILMSPHPVPEGPMHAAESAIQCHQRIRD